MTADYFVALKAKEMSELQEEFNLLFDSIDAAESKGKPNDSTKNTSDNTDTLGYNDPNELPLDEDEEDTE